MGLLDHDNERNWVMEEASSIRFGPQLREVFCTILLPCMPADPLSFRNMWKQFSRGHYEEQAGDHKQEQQEKIEFDGLDMNFGLLTPDPSIVHLA